MAWKISLFLILFPFILCFSEPAFSVTPGKLELAPPDTDRAMIDIVKTVTRVPVDQKASSDNRIYSITVRNSGGGDAGANSIFLVDQLPIDHIFYNGQYYPYAQGNEQEESVIVFAGKNSGLDFDESRDVAFSNQAEMPAGFAECNYVPASGYDPEVRHICLNPKGVFAAGNPVSEFTIRLRTKIRNY